MESTDRWLLSANRRGKQGAGVNPLPEQRRKRLDREGQNSVVNGNGVWDYEKTDMLTRDEKSTFIGYVFAKALNMPSEGKIVHDVIPSCLVAHLGTTPCTSGAVQHSNRFLLEV